MATTSFCHECGQYVSESADVRPVELPGVVGLTDVCRPCRDEADRRANAAKIRGTVVVSRVDTRQYYAAHGKNPRGVGSWAFEFKINGRWTAPVFSPPGLAYFSAKEIALQRANAAKALAVRVCS
jgi:hypothetical protein